MINAAYMSNIEFIGPQYLEKVLIPNICIKLIIGFWVLEIIPINTGSICGQQ